VNIQPKQPSFLKQGIFLGLIYFKILRDICLKGLIFLRDILLICRDVSEMHHFCEK